MGMGRLASLGLAAVYVAGVYGNGSTPPDCSKAPLSNNKICNTSLSPRERATALVSAMQTSEKLANLVR